MTGQKSIKVGVRADDLATELSARYGVTKAQVVELALRKMADDAAKNGGLCIRPVAKSKKGVAIGQNTGKVRISQGNR